MSLLQFEKSLVDNKQKELHYGERLTTRRHHCIRCKTVLALQMTTHGLDKQSAADYYVIVGAQVSAGEAIPFYRKERWFGNYVKCPVCGIQGKLPQDKPLNWEHMQQVRRNDAVPQSNN